MFIDYFNGNLTTSSVVQALMDALSHLIPVKELQALYSHFSRLFSVIKDGITGNVGIGTIGQYIGTLAVDICGLLPACKFATIISILWNMSGVL